MLSKYQNNKYFFVILIISFILLLYFMPTAIVFEYDEYFQGKCFTTHTQYFGWFYYWLGDMMSIAAPTLILSIISLIFAILTIKNKYFSIGTLISPILTIAYICYFVPKALHFGIKEIFYLVFVVLIICLFILCVALYLVKPKKHHNPTKDERIADLEKQIAELQSKLPSESD